MPEEPQHYGGTSAPLVAGDLVIAGVAGADQGIRGFVAAYKATTGQLAWRFWTIPRRGEPGFETWQGNAVEMGGGSTWLTGSTIPSRGCCIGPPEIPYPDTDGDDRKGDIRRSVFVVLNPTLYRSREAGSFQRSDEITPIPSVARRRTTCRAVRLPLAAFRSRPNCRAQSACSARASLQKSAVR
jgi:hypothetical protein